jgi:hypothetical protein
MTHQDDGPPNDLPNTPFVAIVMDARKGEALALSDLPGCPEPVTVAGHGANTPWLDRGDSVLVMPTPQGPVIFDRLRRAGEPPRIGFDMIGRAAYLRAEGIRLQSGRGRVEITADGEVCINQ